MAEETISYDGAFEEALRALLAVAWKPIAPDEIERTCDWLADLRLPEIGSRVRNAQRAQHPRVVRRLALRAYAERFGDLRHGHGLALRAVEVAEYLPYAAEHESPRRCGPSCAGSPPISARPSSSSVRTAPAAWRRASGSLSCDTCFPPSPPTGRTGFWPS